MRRPLTDIALLSYIAKQHADVISYSEATRACKSSSSASRALHQLIREGLIEPRPKLVGLRYVTEYSVTQKGKEVAGLALQLTQLRQSAPKIGSSSTSSPSSPPKRVRSQDDSKRARKKKKHKSSRSSSSTSSIQKPILKGQNAWENFRMQLYQLLRHHHHYHHNYIKRKTRKGRRRQVKGEFNQRGRDRKTD